VNRPDPARFSAARRHFEALADLEDADRRARLAELRAADPGLAQAVEDLLAADSAAGESFLGDAVAGFAPSLLQEAMGAPDADRPETDLAGKLVGPYRLRTLLGRGGMGEVWEAERADGQFEQVVALKLLKRGMDSAAVLTRFLRERQILARLEHPNIARLLDGGVADDGRPYLVLERVEGEPIHQWCRRHGTPIAARLRLMIAVCDAVDTAHRSLVVHRDLKPSNILVDIDGRVKLLDFGIAKLLTGEGESAGDLTRLEERVLTPAYAAPEQILGQAVTTATDVYAMGVVLYELLAGRLPHRRDTGSAAALAEEVERETLVRPSRSAATAADARQLAGDLDTIVLKALAREPERRYGGAAALAADLERHLDGRPVLARPDRVGYRVAKFVARHRVVVGAASLAVLALVAGTGVSIWQARLARIEAAKATAIQKFVFGLFEVNRVRNPDGAKARQTTAEDLLKLAAAELEKSAPSTAAEREVHSELEDTIADLLADLGLHDEAVRLWSALAGELEARAPDERLAEVLVNRGVSANLVGGADEARIDFERALAILDGIGDRSSVLRGWTLYNLGHHFLSSQDAGDTRAEELFRAAIAVLEPHGPSRQLANAHYGLGRVLESRGEPEGAKLAFRAGIAVAEVAPETARTVAAGGHQQLSRVEMATQDFALAEESIRRAMAVFEEFAGKQHRLTFEAEYDLGRLLDATDRPVEALPHLERALADRVTRLGARHGSSVGTHAMLLLARLHAGDVATAVAAAENLDREVVADPALLKDRGGIVAWVLARALLTEGRLDEAAAALARSRPLLLARLGEESPWLVDAGLLEVELALARRAPGDAERLLAAIPAPLAGAAATDARRGRLELLRSAAQRELGHLPAAEEAAARALELAVREPGRKFRRLAEAEAWRSKAVLERRRGQLAEARAAAASALALYRAALLPASPLLGDLERELAGAPALPDPSSR
jgi:tetratricopeptide (TPR) repeat protein/tRNA A-37 threonylcarbamoyl transferase component Bud32